MKIINKKLLDLPKTVYFNFKVFPLKVAIHLPVFVSKDIVLKNLHRGCVEITCRDIKKFMIQIGSGGSEGQIGSKVGYFKVNTGAKIIFEGTAGFSMGNSIRVDSGVFKIGNNFNSNAFSIYHCVNGIEVGKDVLIGCHVTVRDNDGHKLMSFQEVNNIKKRESIVIGNKVWICAKVDLLKGSLIPNGCVVGYRSCVLKSFQEENCLIGGYPAKVLRQNIRWEK